MISWFSFIFLVVIELSAKREWTTACDTWNEGSDDWNNTSGEESTTKFVADRVDAGICWLHFVILSNIEEWDFAETSTNELIFELLNDIKSILLNELLGLIRVIFSGSLVILCKDLLIAILECRVAWFTFCCSNKWYDFSLESISSVFSLLGCGHGFITFSSAKVNPFDGFVCDFPLIKFSYFAFRCSIRTWADLRANNFTNYTLILCIECILLFAGCSLQQWFQLTSSSNTKESNNKKD